MRERGGDHILSDNSVPQQVRREDLRDMETDNLAWKQFLKLIDVRERRGGGQYLSDESGPPSKWDLMSTIRTAQGYLNSTYISSREGHTDLVSLLLKCRADVNLQDGEGLSSLMEAVSCGCLDMCLLLLRYRAKVNLQDSKGWSPLMLQLVTLTLSSYYWKEELRLIFKMRVGHRH